MDTVHLVELQNQRVDTVVSIAKGMVGVIPSLGGLFSEIITLTIPNQRLDRITQFLVELDKRLETIERNQLKENKYALDLFEDGILQASRAMTEERNKYIAVFLKKTINVNQDSYGTKKKLFYILEELTDRDIDILREISLHSYHRAAREHYPHLMSNGAYRELTEQEQYEHDSQEVSWGMHIATLERLGLLHAKREKPDLDGTSHHIDTDSGMPRITDYNVSKLGKVFLFSIKE